MEPMEHDTIANNMDTPYRGDAKNVGDTASPTRGRSRGDTSKPSGRGRSPRSACNFCHDKRVKCVMTEGAARCEQCIQRDTNCVFSIKGKTGPKPKAPKSKSDAHRQRGKTSRRSRRASDFSADTAVSAASVLPKEEIPSGREVNVAAAPVAANTAAGGRERVLLNIYIRTIGKLLPLVEEEALIAGLKKRQRLPQAIVTAVGGNRVSCEQAQVVGAICLGALITGDVDAAKAYHFSLRYHTGDVATIAEPWAAPSLGLGALYWQHLGEDELKAEWVGHARRVLCGANEVPVDIILCIEHLDYAREAHVRTGIDTLLPSRRALHTISCLLSNMPVIVNPGVGRSAAVAFCDDLGVCIRGLREEASPDLSLLLCKSLRALLLVMLGRRDAALAVLETVPCLADAATGGDPCVVRALPLSWDAVLIASALSFLLGEDDTYRRLRAAVEVAMDVPPAARWTYCLPEPGSDPRAYVTHECHSSSNICTIMCEIASTTAFGLRPFYPDDNESLSPPAVELSPHQQTDQADCPAEGNSCGYGAGDMAMMRAPPGDWGCAGAGGGPFENSGGVGGAATVRPDVVVSDSIAGKRRRVVDEDVNAPESVGMFPEVGATALPPANPIIDGAAKALTSARAGECNSLAHSCFAIKDEGKRGFVPGRIEEDEGLGLTRGLHNMSLSRLSAPLLPGGGVAPGGLNEDHGLLGRIPSEGIMDLGSTLGSFAMDIGSTGDAVSHTDNHSGDDESSILGSMIGGGRRSHRRLSSFSTYSTSLCRSGSMLRAGGGSIGHGSDLGQDMVVATDDFLDEEGTDDICRNILSVDAILADIGGVASCAPKKGGGAGGDGEGGAGSRGGHNVRGDHQLGGGASVGLSEQNKIIARAVAALRGNSEPAFRTPAPSTAAGSSASIAGRNAP